MSLQSKAGNRAIVIGNSISGKLAARVLSDFYQQVILIEKDIQFPKRESRKGVPQDSQGHVLLKSGVEILENLLCSQASLPVSLFSLGILKSSLFSNKKSNL